MSPLLHTSLCESVDVPGTDESAAEPEWTQLRERHSKHFCLQPQQQEIYSFHVQVLLWYWGASFPMERGSWGWQSLLLHIHPEGVCAGWGYSTACSSGAATDSGRMEGMSKNVLQEVRMCFSNSFQGRRCPGSTAGSSRGEVGCIKRWGKCSLEHRPRSRENLPALLAGVSLETNPNIPTDPLRLFSPVSRFTPVMFSRQNS